MNTSQKQFNSNTVLESYLIESKQKFNSKNVELVFWVLLSLHIIYFANLLAEANKIGLIDFQFNFPSAINFALIVAAVLAFMPKTTTNKQSIINTTEVRTFKSSVKLNAAKAYNLEAISELPNADNAINGTDIKSNKEFSKLFADYNYDLINFGKNMQYNGLYSAKPFKNTIG